MNTSTTQALAAPFEHFAELPNIPGYRISTFGRIQSDLARGPRRVRRTGVWKDLKPMPDRSGHLRVTIQGRHRYIHVLVLEVFVGPRPKGQDALHNDGDPRNNRLENLRWGTRRENISDADRHGRLPKGQRHWNARLTEETVRVIRRLLTAGHGVCEVARRVGISHQQVSKIGLGLRWKHVEEQP
jgi:HNH endonuclease